jgi:anti-sigma factor RsiW
MQAHKHSEKCREVFAQLSDYLNMELPAEACLEMEAHIAACAPCVEFTESLRRTVELCRQYQPGTLPPPLSEEARAKLQQAYRKMLAEKL